VQKCCTPKRRKSWKIWCENLTKLAQQTELQLAVILALREHTKTKTFRRKGRLFRLTRQSSSGWENFAGHSCLRRTCWETWFALNQLSVVRVQYFFGWSRTTQWSLVLTDDILYMFVCLIAQLSYTKKDVCIFLEFFKRNKRVCVFCIVREIALHVLSLECFCSKKWKRYNASSRPGFFWRTLYFRKIVVN